MSKEKKRVKEKSNLKANTKKLKLKKLKKLKRRLTSL
jgi:hypothetical protein